MKYIYARFWIAIFILSFFPVFTYGQTVTISTGPAWTDGMIQYSSDASLANLADRNFNTFNKLLAMAWTNGGRPIFYRSLLRFDLGAIPVGATVQSATLFLYSDPAFTSGYYSNDGSNAVYFQRITSAWNPTTVTWNNQPATTTANRVYLPQSTSYTENVSVNLTSIVQDMVSNPSANFGLMMSLENEVYYWSRGYANSKFSNSSLYPKIVINYAIPPDTSTFTKKADYIFQNLDKSQIPNRMLYDRVAPWSNLDQFGQNGRNDTSSNSHYLQAHSEIFHSLYDTTTLPSPSIMKILVTKHTGVDTIPMGLLYYNINVLDTNAITNNQLRLQNGQLYDVANRASSPYITKKVIVSSPMIGKTRQGIKYFKFPRDLIWFNVPLAVTNIQITGDNNQNITLTPNGSVNSLTFNSSGLKILIIKVTFSDNSTQITYAKLGVI